MDPTLMSVRQLRSVLSEYGVEVPSSGMKKADLMMLYLEEGIAAKAMERERTDRVLKKKKRKSSSIPWADVDVVPKKAQRKSLGHEEPRESSSAVRRKSTGAKRKSTGRKGKSPAVERKRKRSTLNVFQSATESESESEDDTVMTEAYGTGDVIDLSLSPSPSPSPPVRRRGRASEDVRTKEKRLRAELEKKEREKESEERERLKKEKELLRKQEKELMSLRRAQELERKRVERRQSEEIAKITAKREALERQKQRLQAAISERDVSSHESLAVPAARESKRRATASPRAQKRASLLPRLTPENTRRRAVERERFSPSPVQSPVTISSSDVTQWPSAPLSPPDHRHSYGHVSDEESHMEEEEEEEEEFVYREEDEEGLSLEVLVTAVVLLLFLSVGVFLFINFRPIALPFCTSERLLTRTENENCIPCPRHGSCEGQEVTCDRGFVKQWAGGKWHCVEDLETKRIAHAVLTNEFDRLLRQRKGERDCNQLARPVMLEHEAKIELEDMLKARVGSKKASSSFDDFYREVERLVTLDPELPVSREAGTAGYYFTTSNAPLRPIGCAVKLFLIEKSLYIALVGFVAGVVAFKVWQIRAVSRTKNIVLHELKKARAEDNSGVSIVHLRDSVAPPSLLKGFVWSGVCASIEADSRVGRTLQLLNGEHQDMWEWEAPL